MSIEIRKARVHDARSIAQYNCAMAQETEGHTLDMATLSAGVLAVFERPERGSYWVAERDGKVVGCLLVTHEWSDWRNGDIWWIQSVYVVPAVRRCGVFTALYRAVEAAARAQAEVCGLRLYVEQGNAVAQAVYQRLGMRDSGYRVMEAFF